MTCIICEKPLISGDYVYGACHRCARKAIRMFRECIKSESPAKLDALLKNYLLKGKHISGKGK